MEVSSAPARRWRWEVGSLERRTGENTGENIESPQSPASTATHSARDRGKGLIPKESNHPLAVARSKGF